MPGTDDAAVQRPERTVPGVVRLMTTEPLEVPTSASEGQSSLREMLAERPWLVAAAIVVMVAALAVLARRRR